ncbi:2-dehydropantoate 2-reductase [Halopseudomonas sp.]|uniref:2-dehydropantoate 2-reductase n=1 Tax=Halopseudomonas sp. TaxID=2901191 RepID=UPI003566BE29
MRFDILGPGSLGLLWAARLASAGHSVRLLVRTPEAFEHWQAIGGRLIFEHDNIREELEIEICLDPGTEPLHRLVVATKAYAVPSALNPLAHLLGPDSTLVMLQNGIGSQQYARELCKDSQVLCASVTDGAWLRAPGHVVWAGKGLTRIGDEAGGPCPPWLAALAPPALDWVWEQDIAQVLWQKLAINCAINPFTVLHDCRNGEVPARAGSELDALIRELKALLHSQGFAPQAAELAQVVADVIRRTALNSSSMRQDVHAGRQTEIDYIIGYACRTAVREGIGAPVMTGLYARLKTHLAMHGLANN